MFQLHPNSPYWVRYLMPLLANAQDSLIPSVLQCLNRFAENAIRYESLPDISQTASAVLEEIRLANSVFRPLLSIQAALVGRLLTFCPERAEEYVPALVSEFWAQSDARTRANLLVALGRVRGCVSNWRELLAVSIGEESKYMRFVAATELVALEGDGSSPVLLNIVSDVTTNDLFLWSQLPRALQGLSQQYRIGLLVRLLGTESTTAGCLAVAKLILEYVYGKGEVVSGPGLVNRPELVYEFALVGPAPTAVVSIPQQNEADWLGAIIAATPLEFDTHGRHPNARPVDTNLYQIFGLPRDRTGLKQLWSDASQPV